MRVRGASCSCGAAPSGRAGRSAICPYRRCWYFVRRWRRKRPRIPAKIAIRVATTGSKLRFGGFWLLRLQLDADSRDFLVNREVLIDDYDNVAYSYYS